MMESKFYSCSNFGLRAAAFTTLPLMIVVFGCNQSEQRSESAKSLPAVASDPQEAQAAEYSELQQNWPGWRGVNTSGISADQNVPIQWTTQQGIRWHKTVPGRGNSSPVVWGDHVIVTSASGEVSGSRLVVFSFDRRTGDVQWQRPAGEAHGDTHQKNGYASASVTTDGKYVFASFGAAGLFAFDLKSGNQIWRQDLGTLEHQWGAASSPVLVGDMVVQLCDSSGESNLKAFDKASGQPVWKTPRASTGCWSTPVLIEAMDAGDQPHQELIVNGTGEDGDKPGFVIAYDHANGNEIWRVQGTTDIVCPTAIIGGNLIVSTSGRNGPILAIKPGGAGDVTATNVVWKHSRGGPYVPTGLAYRNRLYLVGEAGVVTCFNLGDGNEIWQHRLRGPVTASLVAANGHIYVTNEYGEIFVLAAGDEFQLLATNDMQEKILATPAMAGGDLFIRTETQLYCVAGQPATELAREVSDAHEK